MNAYQLMDAAFDNACNFEESIYYIQKYADGAFNLFVSDTVAQKILDCRAATEEEENGEGENNGYYLVRRPLEEIEL